MAADVVVHGDRGGEGGAAIGRDGEAEVASREASPGDRGVVLPDQVESAIRADADAGRRLVVWGGIAGEVVDADRGGGPVGAGVEAGEVDIRRAVVGPYPGDVDRPVAGVDRSGRATGALGGQGEVFGRFGELIGRAPVHRDTGSEGDAGREN